MAHSERRPHSTDLACSVRTTIGWFSAQLALAVAGAGITLFGPWPGLGMGLLALVSSLLTLGLGQLPASLAEAANRSGKNQQTRNAAPTLGAEASTKSKAKTVSDSLAIIGLITFVGLIFTVAILPALMALLLLAQLAINLVSADTSRLFYGLMNGFAFLLIGAAESTSGGYLLIMVGYAFCVVMTLSMLWCIQAMTTSQVTRLASSANDQQPHFLMAAEADTPTPGATSRRFNKRFFQPAAATGAALLLVAIAGAIYLFMPRLPAANLGGQLASADSLYDNASWQTQAKRSGQPSPTDPQNLQDDQQSDGPIPLWEGLDPSAPQFDYRGFRDEMNLNDNPYGNQSTTAADLNQVIALMKAPHGSYLKVRTFDHFDGLRWSSSTTAFHKHNTNQQGKVILPGEQENRGNFQQQITIKQGMTAQLPAAGDPVALWLPATVIATDPFGQPLLPAPLKPGTQYTVLSQQQWLDQRPASHAPKPRDNDLQLPYSLDKRIPALARSVTANADTPYAQAQALEQHLRSDYRYSFESALTSQGITPLPSFLFERREGHCEYFASAMVVLLRTLDIPARLVTGFSANQQNPLTGYFEIRGIDGHAWAEAWIDQRWVAFEPTAFYQLPSTTSSSLSADQINDYVDSLSQRQHALPGDSAFSFDQILTTLWNALYLLLILPLSYLLRGIFWLWPLWLVLALVLAIVAAVAYPSRQRWWRTLVGRWVTLRLQRYRAKDPATALTFYQRQLQQLSAACGIQRSPGQPLEVWSQALQDYLLARANQGTAADTSEPEPTAALQQLVALLNTCWYGDPETSTAIQLPETLQPGLIELANRLTARA
ncbi:MULTISPECIES: transglutaminase domain-containing protein [unclassified Oceanobacter]|uniref:transglutaminase family protein n=2 Tax=Gammaproteobacteria TaxID=1236 RepID=UPI002733E603|nr:MULTISPECIES: transglutaminase domain-containing protein [unclassified Oceanobacter]MDP2546257.1 transglutaminaseTgpA domain-containing protein [Oceanobacter sp. 4_MG-2023]MDP2607559.1 transglutaminaseTgpA domain-containing protein [Oceanobacter sp. 1_MG-2023]MDP2610827.1 transglutaminaseTgpA domain-containing protein [Oceanobacter sp. 2_MG-2023]